MKALRVHAYGEPDDLRIDDLESPRPGPDEIRIKTVACGANFADGLLIAGKYQAKPPFPFGPGFEVAGTVDALGENVSGFGLGDRVIGLPFHSGYAEEVLVPADKAVLLPDNVPFEIGAAIPIVYLTSHLALIHKARLQSHETLLVHGASGGVGLTAVEIGRVLGARVIAAASSGEKLEIARQAGAAEVINSSQEDVRVRVKELTGNAGADVVYDPVGGAAFDASLRAINFEGRILAIGFASGTIPQIPANIVMVKSIDVLGLNLGGYMTHRADLIASALAQILNWVGAGEVNPYVSEEFPLEEGAAAIRHIQQRKAKGKVVVRIG